MHKLEEIYQNESYIDDIEFNLFEPECIITDITKDEILNVTNSDNSEENLLPAVSLEIRNDLNFPTSNFRDCLTIKQINMPVASSQEDTTYEINSRTDTRLDSLETSLSSTDLEMHSVFTPDKRFKAKEIFTQCNFCGKYVISRMCTETGVYSKCKHCLNSPFSVNTSLIEMSIRGGEEEEDVLPIPIEPEISIETDTKFSGNVFASVAHSKAYNPTFKCDHCGKMFTRNWYLKQHIKLHSNEKPFGCDLCDKRFLNSSNLKQHMKTHSVEYRCSICSKTYVNQYTLKEHMQVHTDQISVAYRSIAQTPRELRCRYCPQTFDDESRLKVHLQTHTKELPYHCDKCDRAFRYHNSLVKHRRSHEGGSEGKLVKVPKRCEKAKN